MNSAAKEKKRAADREAQRVNRARTKAYITQLEQTIQDLTGPNPPDNLGQNLAQQQRKIHHLEDTLRKIDILAQSAATGFLPSSVSDHLSVHPPYPSQAASETEPLASGLVENLSSTTTCNFFDFDLTCSDRERNYLAVLGNAMIMIQEYSFTLAGSMMLLSTLDDDNFCIRAVVDGWKNTTDRFGADVIWDLIQAIDKGLYYRADPVTRIALLRIMRSLMLVRFWPFTQFLLFTDLPQAKVRYHLQYVIYSAVYVC
ncbi:uncharacterized protein N7500_006682 [Penicillium coprophilum]|uniref:uncharacterized protein n=1 Tax=Penicillium coprophilum TaxID=36646 RepID=UPI002394E4A9|nr:uncharacterized protein N7500_006682 [Penicillium coprophilum]KAJ5164852.1 hypothetical protein N7500_006682 [Penicillium coprophilum]